MEDEELRRKLEWRRDEWAGIKREEKGDKERTVG